MGADGSTRYRNPERVRKEKGREEIEVARKGDYDKDERARYRAFSGELPYASRDAVAGVDG